MNKQNNCIQNNVNSNPYEILKEIYLDLMDEKNELEKQIDINNDYMREIDCYIKTILENDDVNIKVFSPRNTESLYKDKIYDNQNNRTVFENENKYLYKRLNVILNRTDKLKNVLDIMNNEKRESTEHHSIVDKTTDIDLLVDLQDMESTMEPTMEASMEPTIEPIIDSTDIMTDTVSPKNYPINYKSIKINILDIQEKERQRIARDLHDSTVQNLTHLIHKIELSTKFMDQDILRAKLEMATMNKSVKEIIQEIRNTIFNLRPMVFDDMGINIILERFKDKLVEKSNMEIVFCIDKIPSLDNLLLVTIFRAIHECGWNAIQHSNGSRLSIELKYNKDNVEIIVKDDGIGFEFNELENSNNHFGLSILRERIFLLSGKIEISKINTKGTLIYIIIPHREGKIYD